jgi:uncharacterized metal-binding protein YceD (DUF177 family)
MAGIFTIPLKGLNEGRYNFDFKVDNEFFEKFEESEIKEGSLSAAVEMDKRASHFDVIVKLLGTVMISCDRCLEEFSYSINCEHRLIVKPQEEALTGDDADMVYFSADEYELDLRQHLYEFIHLALPIRRVHPADKDGKTGCNPEMIKRLNELLIDEEQQNIEDPRWDELKKLMNNKN